MAQTENDIQQAVQLIHTFVDRLPLFLRDHETNNGLPAEISDNFKQLETQIERTNHLVLESINSSNRRFDEMLKSSNKRFDDIIKSSNKRFDEIKEEFDDIRARMEYYNRLAHARSLNSSAHIDEGPIYPLPLANGENPPPEDFPHNVYDFRQLDVMPLRRLLERYQLPVHDDPVENHATLAVYLSIRW